MSSGMCINAAKDAVDCIANDVAKIKRLMLNTSLGKNEVPNNYWERVVASEIG